VSESLPIIGIDPGTSQSAAVILSDGSVMKTVWMNNMEMVRWLRVFPAPAVLAVEMVASYGMAVGQEVFDTCLWIGRFIEAWDGRGLAWHKLYRKKTNPPFPSITMHLCKTTRAKDANVRQALIDRFGPGKDKAIGKKASPGPLYGLSGDMWSALAVAVVCQDAMERSEA
jgi:hypothetical protein